MAEGILILSNPGYYGYDSSLDYLVLAVEGTALLVLLAALSGLHARLATSYGRTGTVGFLAAFAGTALAGAGHMACRSGAVLRSSPGWRGCGWETLRAGSRSAWRGRQWGTR